jgi:hypothetical protein
VLFEDLGRDAEEFHFQGVGIGDEAAHEVVRAAGNRCKALAQHPASAAFGHRDGCAAVAQKMADHHL